MKSLNKFSKFFAQRTALLFAVLGITASLIGFAVVQKIDRNQVQADNCDATICVSLKPDGMNPSELAVKVGQTVQFNSADGQNHNISEGDGAHGHDDEEAHDHVGSYSSGEFGPDEAWRVEFKKAGTYKLHDHYNPKQNILVVVYEEQ